MAYGRPAWAEINLSAVKNNIRHIKGLLKPNTKFCAIVKADAYSHGAAVIAKTAQEMGADYIGVAIFDEAVTLRDAGITLPILILGPTPDIFSKHMVANNFTATIFTKEQADSLSAAALALGTDAKVHIKIDTGMSRIGITPDEAADFYAYVKGLPRMNVEGTFTHFATADSADKTGANKQFSEFTRALKAMEAKAGPIPIKHSANSAAIVDMPETHLDMVRAGIILYGLWPSDETTQPIPLEPVMKLKARVSAVKTVGTDVGVGYGFTAKAPAGTVIATLPLGYADGYTRLLSNKASVLIRGQRAPIIGNICMDQCMINVSRISDIQEGDEVLLFGGSDLPVEELAALLGTINYEMVTTVGKRVPRLYIAP